MDELWVLYLSKFIPLILAQIYLDIGYDPSRNDLGDIIK